ncbi:hypothetical protein ASPFODRAFT_67810 [Aspergillus luchuensis CBS 106.47]|uniref:Uncharacterized protein n=1 Tax=Aspergillus luchuensis (strain CBS 106.47) TaxID=1137211 RepID=A0A1M3TVI4_ASPLC|nr:hypothetical protein ASPFODRAFT_67810 [Aspergillus luchuensis CBS 106.47]
MHFTTTIATTIALAGYAAAQSGCHAGATADCKPGFNYCASTLQNRGEATSAIRVALTAGGYEGRVNTPGIWGPFIFHCNDDYTLTLVETCENSDCVDGGLNKNDHCGRKWGGIVGGGL